MGLFDALGIKFPVPSMALASSEENIFKKFVSSLLENTTQKKDPILNKSNPARNPLPSW